MSKDKNSSVRDQVARKRLKQKALDRWENEGGRTEMPQDQRENSAKPKPDGKRSTKRPRNQQAPPGKPAK